MKLNFCHGCISHSYEHTLQFFTLGIGAQIYYAEGIDKLVVNMVK